MLNQFVYFHPKITNTGRLFLLVFVHFIYAVHTIVMTVVCTNESVVVYFTVFNLTSEI